MKYEKRLRKEGNMPRLTYQAKSLPLQREFGRVALPYKQHVVLGKKRKCQRVEESGLRRIQRERGIEVQYLPNGTHAGYM
jgi:hypothetical protein